MTQMLKLCIENKYNTDKYYFYNEYGHTYVELFYGERFLSRKHTAKNLLEIGIGTGGGSLLLWRDYFVNANITGVDITYCDKVPTQNRISQVITDAYSQDYIDTLQDNFYDILIDDGPHTFETMEIFLKSYTRKLRPNGIMVIEDIPEPEWCKELTLMLPPEYQPYVEVFDFRHSRMRYDDVMMIVDLPH